MINCQTTAVVQTPCGARSCLLEADARRHGILIAVMALTVDVNRIVVIDSAHRQPGANHVPDFTCAGGKQLRIRAAQGRRHADHWARAGLSLAGLLLGIQSGRLSGRPCQ